MNEYLCAMNAARPENYISYSGIDMFDEDSKHNFSLTSNTNIEESMIKKDLIDNMSQDALFLLETIINSPELVATPKTKNVTKKSIIIFLEDQKWHPKRIKKAFGEIKNYLKNL